MDRRDFLRTLVGTVGAATTSSLWTRAARAQTCPGGEGPYGPLLSPDANGLMLPAGFRSRVVARGNQEVGDTGYIWHTDADGGAVFPAAGGHIYVSNCEKTPGGSVSAIRFDVRGRILDAYQICTGTNHNCAGGATPWGTWLSCEERSDGRVWECDPFGIQPHVVRPEMGRFQHEAVAVDEERRQMYLTEDHSDGGFYRFTPNSWGDLSVGGVLEVAKVAADDSVSWSTIPDPDGRPTATRFQVESTAFNGGEGCVYSAGHVYFTTKGDQKVYDHDVVNQTMGILYELAGDPINTLTQPDNICVSRSGDLVVAEDVGNLELVLLDTSCIASPLVRVTGQSNTEVAGPAWDPLGRRLYFSSQRGGGAGITYEVTGPFRRVG